MKESYDVLVVGAGPAGSAAARKCVGEGLKTLLVEKHKLPRRKACSGIIANKSYNYVLENFGPIPEDAHGKPYYNLGMAFHFPSVGTVFGKMECYAPYVWRDKFDYFLAKKSGADLEDQTRFISAKENGDKVEVTLAQRKDTVKVDARYVIGADGANSHVIRNIAPEAYEGIPWAFAIQKYYEGKIDADNRFLYGFLVRGMGPFPWLNLKDDQIIVGLASPLEEKWEPKFELLLNYLKKNFGLEIKRELATEGCLANLMTPLNRFFPGRGRVLIAGEAMGLMHQGDEGISCALASGGIAGEAVIRGVKGEDALAVYKRLVKPEMEIALDQFNPFRIIESSSSFSSPRRPKMLVGFSLREKARLMRDAWDFVKNELLAVGGIGSAVLKNTLRRQILRKYRIPAAD
ncbi:MAG: NAD(P)/FAD-dependent oxidoreductase [Deltaproteobacteria bacterium]|nr:MAG: NAD(P)/FAD-dependent oxidoreductase [Deltaproteobacteria bacterium]